MGISIPEFRGPFTSEAEVEAAMDSLVITVQGTPGTADTPSVIDENRLNQVEFVIRTLGFLTRESGAQVICEANTPTYDACTVFVDTDALMFRSSWLSRCISLADYIRVFPSPDGEMKLSMVFNGVIRKETIR